jgi:cell wall-associated NlpC family hydrolase
VALAPAPSKPDAASLRNAYCNALEAYQGCPYIWGGETYSAIDCSGLVRKALEDALTTRGIMTLNAGLIRSALWLYWHDTTAKVIGQGYSGQTIDVSDHLDNSLLQPGDMAILNSGGHVLAYLGQGMWIEADPGVGRVIKHPFPKDYRNGMTIVRWKVLSD